MESSMRRGEGRRGEGECKEKVEEACAVPDDLSNNRLSRAPTKHVNVPTVSLPCPVSTATTVIVNSINCFNKQLNTG